MNMELPRIPIGDGVKLALDWFRTTFDWLLEFFTLVFKGAAQGLADGLLWVPYPLMILCFALLAWTLRSWRLAIGIALGFLLVASMGFWESAMQTLSLVVIATLVSVLLAVPLGIWAARNDRVSAALRPILDFMQTMPAFVWLIPAVLFFNLGYAPGVFATVLFAMPPGVRFTELGIRGVDAETVEAGYAFGATPGQILRGVQLPLAIPTIMAGINQVIMLSLSMVVLAGFVGAEGLGKDVVMAVQTQRLPQGVEAGLSIVVIAIFLDRLTAALGNPANHPKSLLSIARSRRNGAARA